MQTRFLCPACKTHHVLDMPETTISITCSTTGRHLTLELGVGGEPRVTLLTEDGQPDTAADETEIES